MNIDVAPLQYLMKTILIPRHGIPIILIIGSNMSCINILTCSHNLCNLIIVVGFNFDANLTVDLL